MLVLRPVRGPKFKSSDFGFAGLPRNFLMGSQAGPSPLGIRLFFATQDFLSHQLITVGFQLKSNLEASLPLRL